MKILPLTLMTRMGDDRAVFRCHGDKRWVSIVGGATDVRPLALGTNKAGQKGEGTGPRGDLGSQLEAFHQLRIKDLQMVGQERCLRLPKEQLPSIHRRSQPL